VDCQVLGERRILLDRRGEDDKCGYVLGLDASTSNSDRAPTPAIARRWGNQAHWSEWSQAFAPW
jgi:hypothetical protein